QPSARAVFKEHPIGIAIAVEPERQRIRSSPPARLFVEPAEKCSAWPTIFCDREFSRHGKLFLQGARSNWFRVECRRHRTLDPATDFPARCAPGVLGILEPKILPDARRRVGH